MEAQKIVYEMVGNRKSKIKRTSFDCDDRKMLEESKQQEITLKESPRRMAFDTICENIASATNLIETFLFFLVGLEFV